MTTPTAPGSTGYGVDIYGTVLYGYSQPASLSVEPFLATQTDYGRLTLTWQSPNDTDWRSLRLVRSTDGYPSTPSDGTLLLEARSDSIRTTYDDAELTQGMIYYYSIFMSLDAATWSSATTYIQSAVVFYNGVYWKSLQASNTNNTPSIGSAWWATTTYFPIWYPAGNAASLVIKDQGYSDRLYDRTPQPYKITKSDLFANTIIDNPSLARYLSLFGFALSDVKTEYDNLLNLNDPDLVSAINLDWLGRQFGITTDYISSPRLRRDRIKNASVNYRLKGTWQGIHNAIAEVTGWDSSLRVGNNLMLNSDQSAFANPRYAQWSPDINYAINMFIQYNGFNYKCIVGAYGAAQAPTGTATSNTWWQVQQRSVDTTSLTNPITRGISTWGRYQNAGVTSTIASIVGVPNPSNTSYNAWNGLGFQQQSPIPGVTTTGVVSIATISTPTWLNSTNYVVNNYVLYNTFYYRARRASGPATPAGFVTPGTNDLYWELQASNVGVGRGQFVRDGIPLPLYPTWDVVIPFAEGAQVQYQGIVYICLIANTGKAPSGRYSSNQYWQYVETAEQVFTSSSYTSRVSSTTSVTASQHLLWYDNDGNLLVISQAPTVATQFARFDTDYPNLNNTNDNTTNVTWVATPTNTTVWESVYGQARVNPETFSGLVTKPKYTYIALTDSRTAGVLGFTFGLDTDDPTNYENGVLFRRSGSNFMFVTRTRLGLFNSGTETTLASWTRLADWDRVTVTITSTTITVRKYNRDGTGGLTQLANVTNSTLNTGTGYGILQRYAPGV